MRLTQWLEECRDDVRFALRQLRAAPTFALVATITLALGIGANSAIFALVDAILLRPLPFPESQRLAIAWQRTDRTPRGRASAVDILDWSDRGRSLEHVAGFVPGTGGAMVMAGANGAFPLGRPLRPRAADVRFSRATDGGCARGDCAN
jgi:putative ABC transport system permease protein